MKDHDVTWLYGPLQSGCAASFGPASPGSTPRLARSDSLVSKKSILKKRSLSEAMLQRSLSHSNLIQRAVDSVVSQGPNRTMSRPHLGERTVSDYAGSRSAPSPSSTSDSSSNHASTSTSGLQTPNEKRRIHFSNKVEQCIAINEDGDELDDGTRGALNEDTGAVRVDADDEGDDNFSDDGIIMMKIERGKEQKLHGRNDTPRSSFSSDSGNKTIAMLPSTTLKYRSDTPDLPENTKQEGAVWDLGRRLVRSSSQETLKPSRPSSNFLIDEDEEAYMDWQPSPSSSSSSSSTALSGYSNGGSYYGQAGIRSIVTRDEDKEMENKGLRRTPSGMFMPYDEDEDEVVSAGLLGKVVDTVMTAKDIAHVIWNVGWRR